MPSHMAARPSVSSSKIPDRASCSPPTKPRIKIPRLSLKLARNAKVCPSHVSSKETCSRPRQTVPIPTLGGVACSPPRDQTLRVKVQKHPELGFLICLRNESGRVCISALKKLPCGSCPGLEAGLRVRDELIAVNGVSCIGNAQKVGKLIFEKSAAVFTVLRVNDGDFTYLNHPVPRGGISSVKKEKTLVGSVKHELGMMAHELDEASVPFFLNVGTSCKSGFDFCCDPWFCCSVIVLICLGIGLGIGLILWQLPGKEWKCWREFCNSEYESQEGEEGY